MIVDNSSTAFQVLCFNSDLKSFVLIQTFCLDILFFQQKWLNLTNVDLGNADGTCLSRDDWIRKEVLLQNTIQQNLVSLHLFQDSYPETYGYHSTVVYQYTVKSVIFAGKSSAIFVAYGCATPRIAMATSQECRLPRVIGPWLPSFIGSPGSTKGHPTSTDLSVAILNQWSSSINQLSTIIQSWFIVTDEPVWMLYLPLMVKNRSIIEDNNQLLMASKT